MSRNITDNSFRRLPLSGKLQKILAEPHKAYKAVTNSIFSIVGHHNYQPFLIVTRDRTGSNMLVEYLDSHPHISCGYEILASLESRSGIDRVRSIYGRQPFYVRARGFKIFYYHPIDSDGTATWIALKKVPGLRVIHLVRNNILETAVSSKLAYITGVYGDRGSNGLVVDYSSLTFDYPADKLQSVFEQTRRWENEIPDRFSHCPQIKISYEDLISDPNNQVQRLCDFLGITMPFTPRTNFRKQRQKSLRSVVTNYDALKMHFAGSEWAEFFNE